MLKSVTILLLFLIPGFTIDANRCSTCGKQENDYFCAQNTLAMNFRLCMDITEVPVMLWKSFLSDMKEKHGEGSEEYLSNFPDFKKWEALFPGMTSSVISRKFFNEEALDLMPVVAITYDQILTFCEWRKDKFQKELDAMPPKQRANFPKKFLFRLPTNKEWARIRFMTQEKRMLKQLDKMAAGNMKFFKMKKNDLLNNAYRVSHIYKTKSETLGLYNLFDNVSEMTSARGVAMGGSWKEGNDASVWTNEFNYEGAEAWLGFRCIFEIVE